MTSDTFATGTDPAVTTTPEVADAYARASAHFGELVHAVGGDQWDLPTPCEGWSVRDLVNHVVAENLWAPPLLAGRTIAEVGDAYEGDVLGGDPVAAWDAAAVAARAAAAPSDVAQRTVHLSLGDTAAGEYLNQLFADHLVHGWDLAQAIGADDTLATDLVAACDAWFVAMERAYRQAGAVGERPVVPLDADAQTRLLARFGRSRTLAAVRRFDAAFADHDVDAVMACMTDDCVFESTEPAPDGQRFSGRAEVAGAWRRLFAGAPSGRFDAEETLVAGDRAVVRWTYDWGGGHVRGVDVLRVRDGLVTEKLSYVKG